MNRRTNVQSSSLVLGAALVIVGFFLGAFSQSHLANAQSVASKDVSPFNTPRETLITSSDDGTTIHFWSQAPAGTDKLNPARGFYYQGSRSK